MTSIAESGDARYTRLRRLAIGMFSAISLALLLLGGVAFAALHLEAGVRSYVKGESLWSKARSEAVFALNEYAAEGDEAAWEQFARALEVPLGDREARLALQQEPPDLVRAREGFLQGGLDSGEIGGMIRLFRWLGDWGPMRRAIQIWTQADLLIESLRTEGQRIRAEWESPAPDSALIQAASARVDTLNTRLADLESQFIATLGEASFTIRRWSQGAIGGLVVLLLITAGFLTRGLYHILRGRERDMERHRQKLARILDSLAEGITILDRTGRITYANASARGILRLTEPQILDRSYDSPEWEIFDADGEPVDPEELPAARSLRTGDPVWDETLVVNRAGERPVILSVNAVPYGPEGGETVESIVSFRDVTERRRAEEAVKNAERRFRSIFEDSQDAIYVTALDGTIVEMNPAGVELFGYSAAELVGMNAVELYRNPSDRDRFQRKMAESGRVRAFEAVLRTRSKGDRVCEITATARVEDGRIVGYQGIIRDITDRKKFEERLRHQALHDPLTGLPNRELFWNRVEHGVARARRTGEGIAVLYLDLDRFKSVNDSLGHAAGDEVLVQVARRVSGSLREADTVARLGGDEFAVLLEDLGGREEVELAAERILRAFEAPFSIQHERFHLEVSVGASEFSGEGPGDLPAPRVVDALVRRADQAMFRAKDRPGTRFHCFDTVDTVPDAPRIREENELRRAIKEERFVLHYQPIVSLRDELPWAVEPLIRWPHSGEGLLAPEDFLPLAEETGLILELGRWVLERACRQVADWNRTVREGDPLVVSPNVSAVQFEDPGFETHVRVALEESGLPPRLMELEVTETSVMRAPGRTKALADLGVGICIDDFGTGYSSLSYIKELTADALKIDMSFVHGIGVSPADEAIVRTILMLGRTLEMDVIAEGVETREQARWLEEEGCRWAQGHWFARPMAADEIQKWLSADARPA